MRIRRFGSLDSTASAGTQSSGGGSGTVASFQNGVLTITLNSGSTVAGNVTGDTQIACMTSAPQQSSSDTEDSSSQTQSSSDDDQVQQSSGETDQSSGDSSPDSTTSSCSPATGVTVLGAELRLDSPGNTWERISLGF